MVGVRRSPATRRSAARSRYIRAAEGSAMAIVVLVLWLFTAGAGFYLLLTSSLGRARPTGPAAQPAPVTQPSVAASAANAASGAAASAANAASGAAASAANTASAAATSAANT